MEKDVALHHDEESNEMEKHFNIEGSLTKE